jgi:hypothetical protein
MYRAAKGLLGDDNMGRLFALAVIASALAGCGSNAGYIPVSYTPTYKSAVPVNAQASAQGWYVRCRNDRKSCAVELNVGYAGRYRENVVTGTLSYSVPAERFSLALGSQPSVVQIQIDDNPPLPMRCVGRTCSIATQPLLAQMQSGLVMRLDIKGPTASYPERQSFALWGAFNDMRDRALGQVGSPR